MPSLKPYHAVFCIILAVSLIILKRSSTKSKRYRRRMQMIPKMVSWNVYNLCHGDRTVSSELAGDPELAPYKLFKELYESKDADKSPDLASDEEDAASDELKKAKECGNWGNSEPSTLFLRVGTFTKS